MTTVTPWNAQLIPGANAWVIYRIEDTRNAYGQVIQQRRVHALSGRMLTEQDAIRWVGLLNEPISQ